MDVSPVVDRGRLAAKATVGEPQPVRATVFREGHDRLGAEVVLIDPRGRRREPVRMVPGDDGPDRWVAIVTPDSPGEWAFVVQAWSDPLATWLHDAVVKVEAGVDVELMFTEGALLLERIAAEHALTAAEQRTVTAGREAAADSERPVPARLAVMTSPETIALMRARPLRDLLGETEPFGLRVDPLRALVGSWYEMFPRSEGAYVDATGAVVPGTFRTAAQRLDAVAEMGFDVVYLPPIHPIGEVNRKGPNNTVLPDGEQTPADWVGSPWAIGSSDGGHDAVHPDLGTLSDFDAFVARARELGLDVALDLALQAAPDHPWVAEHPEFFTTRADGTIAYAENPPKKYQDIYPINFDNDPDAVAAEVLRVVRHWMAHGVRIFRVDNPHTKPLAFWEWLLAEVRRTDPDVVFLSEAFTRPAMMHALGAVGFHQSYTYFTWRTGKDEIADYLRELATHSDHLMRPNFFVNTPDILHAFLQYGGPAAFRIRAVLAALSSPSWGVYAGYELYEHVAVRPGSEEYLDSEKYQIRIRDWEGAEASGRTLAPQLRLLNDIRRRHPALRLLRNTVVHSSDDDHVLVWSKRHVDADGREDTVIVVLNLDPHGARETTVHLDLPALGKAWSDTFAVHDEVTDQTWTWGPHNYVRLDPTHAVAHVLTVR
jgi:starch synthase (maltosyl-transferring)